MSKIKDLFFEIVRKNVETIRRFPITVFLTLAETGGIIYLIFSELDDKWFIRLLAVGIMGMLFSVFLALFGKKRAIVVDAVVTILVMGAEYACLQFRENDIYYYMGLMALNLLVFCLILYQLFRKDEDGKLFAYLLSSLLFSLFLCGLLFGGLAICLAAFQYLIYEPKDYYKAYLTVGVLCEFTGAICLFLSYVPTEYQPTSISKAYGTIVHKTLMLVYYMLLLILYAYLIKILVTFTMPVGKLNWFGSFALLFYCFFTLSSQYEETALAKMHQRFGGLILLPILAVQSYAIYIRVAAYGLTTMRMLSILFNLGGFLFMLAGWLKKGYAWVFIGLGVVAVLGLVGPLNVLDAPAVEQVGRLNKVLERNNMLKYGEIVPNSRLSEEDKEIIRSVYDYLYMDDSVHAEKYRTMSIDEFEQTFGFEYFNAHKEEPSYQYCYYYGEIDMDIGEYGHIESVSEARSVDEKMMEYCLNLYDVFGAYSNDVTLPPYKQENGDVLVFTYLSFEYNRVEEKIENLYYDGFCLHKGLKAEELN